MEIPSSSDTEAREGEDLHMGWQLNEEGLLQVEAWREDNGIHRVFASQIRYEDSIL